MILAEGESTYAAESERAAAAREASELEALSQKKKKKEKGRRGRDAGDDDEDEETERATDASERERERAFRERLDEAQRLYRDAVSQRGLSTGMSVPLSAQGPAAVHSLEALARLALTSEPPDYAACEKYCNVILQIQPQHNRALLVRCALPFFCFSFSFFFSSLVVYCLRLHERSPDDSLSQVIAALPAVAGAR